MLRAKSRALAGTAVLALLVAACGSSTSPGTSATASPTGGGTPPPSPSAPNASPSTPAATSAHPTSSVPAGFSCTFPYNRAATTTTTALVTNVRIGRHTAYDRVVFDLGPGGYPAVSLDLVKPPLTADPSDLPVTVAGSTFVRITLHPASGAGYATGGSPSYTGQRAFSPRYPRLTSLVERGDFEAVFSWYAGLTGPTCYRVFTMSEPNLIAIDFAAG